MSSLVLKSGLQRKFLTFQEAFKAKHDKMPENIVSKNKNKLNAGVKMISSLVGFNSHENLLLWKKVIWCIEGWIVVLKLDFSLR